MIEITFTLHEQRHLQNLTRDVMKHGGSLLEFITLCSCSSLHSHKKAGEKRKVVLYLSVPS